MQAHLVSKEEVLAKLKTDLTGLQVEEACERRKKFGKNELPIEKGRSLGQKILAQFADFLVIILIVSAVISFFVGESLDALLIIAIVIINAIFGLVQESKADKALEALAQMSAPKTKVLRNGKKEFSPASELVQGDIVILETGDSVPADMRLLETTNLEIQEAALTGESVAASKDGDFIADEKTQLADMKNMAFMGTVVTYGRGSGVVVSTGINTEVGKIAHAISTVDTSPTPLQIKLDNLGKKLGLGIIIISVVVFLVGLVRGIATPLELFMTAISLAVAAIPEGLPAVVTIVLALGMTKMSKRNAIIRRLLAVETLGTTTVICSDKTGTLTENEMTVTKAILPSGELDITGVGYSLEGEFHLLTGNDSGLEALLSAGVLCNDSDLVERSGNIEIIGDPTEGGLIVAAAKYNLNKEELAQKYPRHLEIPFDSERKRMSTLHSYNNNLTLFVKGAFDELMKVTDKVLIDGKVVLLTDEMREYFTKKNEEMADSALRVLAFAYKEFDSLPEKLELTDESNLVFLGLMGMIDPPRKEAKDAILQCKTAGIKPKMITGDYAKTALAIGKQIGLADENSKVLTGRDISELDDEKLKKLVEEVDIYARVSPMHKVRIVNALKNNGHIVAMTGDGVNDAMALKKADIGISMGITGTDVAKQTADMVLMDDNFASIVGAVEEGRIIYANIRKFVYFLLSCNFAEVLVIFISMLFGLPVPLLPIQLLWVNVLTDAFPALALGVEKGEPNIMEKKPRSPKEPLLDKRMWVSVVIQALVVTLSTLSAFYIGLKAPVENNLTVARTMAFLTLINGELLRAFTCRSEQYTLFELGIFTNRFMLYSVIGSALLLLPLLFIPTLSEAFSLATLTRNQWFVVLLLGFLPLVAGELHKVVYKK